MEITTDMTKVKESKCFGIAWDGDVKECKICEVSNVCKQRTLGGVKQASSKPAPAKKIEYSADDETVSTMKPSNPRPEPKKDTEKSEKAEKKATKAKTEVKYDDNMPDFKPMSVEELLELAKERGLNPADFDKYTSVPIKKMRVTMALKKTYESK